MRRKKSASGRILRTDDYKVKRCDCCGGICTGFWCGPHSIGSYPNSNYPGGPGMPCGLVPIIPAPYTKCYPFYCPPLSDCAEPAPGQPGCPYCLVTFNVTSLVQATSNLSYQDTSPTGPCPTIRSINEPAFFGLGTEVNFHEVSGLEDVCGYSTPFSRGAIWFPPAVPTPTRFSYGYGHHLGTNTLLEGAGSPTSTNNVYAVQGTQATVQAGPWMRWGISAERATCSNSPFISVNVYYNLITGATFARCQGPTKIAPPNGTYSGSVSASVTPRDFLGSCPTGFDITLSGTLTSQRLNLSQNTIICSIEGSISCDLEGIDCPCSCGGLDGPEDWTEPEPIQVDEPNPFPEEEGGEGGGGEEDAIQSEPIAFAHQQRRGCAACGRRKTA